MYVLSFERRTYHQEWEVFVKIEGEGELSLNVIIVADGRDVELAIQHYWSRILELQESTEHCNLEQVVVRRFYPAYLYCSKCGGKFDSEGWCPNYCLSE